MFLQTLKQPVFVEGPDGMMHVAHGLKVRGVEAATHEEDGQTTGGGMVRKVTPGVITMTVVSVIKADGKEISFEGDDFMPDIKMRQDNLAAEQEVRG